MKLPAEVLRAMEALEDYVSRDCAECHGPEVSRDLLAALRRYHAEKTVDAESTHAMRRVRT